MVNTFPTCVVTPFAGLRVICASSGILTIMKGVRVGGTGVVPCYP